MLERIIGSRSLIFGLLAASTVYVVLLLFGYIFGVAHVRRHHVESGSYIFAAAALAAMYSRNQRTRPDPINPRTDLSGWLIPLFIVAAAILYGNTVALGMFSDDFVLSQRALAGEWLPQESLIRPIPLVVWKLLLAPTHGAAALHLFNICLHGLNAALVAFLAARLRLTRPASIAAGLLFLAFPGSVEAVVWPAAVHDLIVTACALSFLLLASGQPVKTARLGTAMAVLIVALLSKETAIVIPFLGIVLWLDPANPRRSPGLSILVFGAATCLAYIAFRMALVAVPISYAQAPTRYLIKEVLARPVATLAMPWTTAVFNSWPVIPFLWVLTSVGVVATYASSTNRNPAPQVILRCLAALIVAVLPLYSILFITPDLENGRYLYLSTAFWVIALVAMASGSGRFTRSAGVVFVMVASVGIGGVQVHLASWREGARVRERVLAAAARVLETAPCEPLSLGGAPDTVRGAFVFRNGLSEAITLRTNAVPAPAAASMECFFLWNGSDFERSTKFSVAVQASFVRHRR